MVLWIINLYLVNGFRQWLQHIHTHRGNREKDWEKWGSECYSVPVCAIAYKKKTAGEVRKYRVIGISTESAENYHETFYFIILLNW